MFIQCGGFLSHRGTPSSHKFLDGIFPFPKTIQLWGFALLWKAPCNVGQTIVNHPRSPRRIDMSCFMEPSANSMLPSLFFLFYPCGMMTFHQRRVSLDHRWSLGITGAEFLWIQWPFIEKERPWRCACPRKPTQRCALLGRCVSTVAAFTGCERSSYWVFCMDSDWWFGCHVLFSHEYWVYV